MKCKLRYSGCRNALFVIDGKKRKLKPHDIIFSTLEEAIRLTNSFNFKADNEETKCMIDNVDFPVDKYDDIRTLLEGKRCFIVGRGESLKGFDFNKLKDEFVIGINAAFLTCNANAVLFLDKIFVKQHKHDLIKFDGFIFSRKSTQYHRMDTRDNVLPFSVHNGNPQAEVEHGLFCGALSGIAALNLAMALKAEKIYLLGYDLKSNIPYYDTGEVNDNYSRENWLDARKKLFKRYMSFGDRIVNCTPKSSLDFFEYQDIEEILKDKFVSKNIKIESNPLTTENSGAICL